MSNKHFTTNQGVKTRRIADSRKRAIREMRLAEAQRRKSQLEALFVAQCEQLAHHWNERAGR